MGEWSPEYYRCEWLDGATNARVGARSVGTTGWAATGGRRPPSSLPPSGREFAFTVVHDETGREETVWRYRFEPSSGGTVLIESFEFLWCPLGNRVVELFVPRRGQVNRGIRLTLRRIAAAAQALAPAGYDHADQPPVKT